MICNRRAWSADAEKGLLVSAGDDLPFIRDQVKTGRALLYYLEDKTGFLWLVIRQDAKTEVCVVCAEGLNIQHFGAAIVDNFKKAGLVVRIHVKRPGMLRIMESLGFQISEYVLRI